MNTKETTAQQGIDETTLEALYNINKHAKKYADRAEKYYANGKGATAKKNSVRKKALYDLKAAILKRLYRNDEVDDIARHEIDDRHYWCLVIGDWSYHSPIDELPISESEEPAGEEVEQIDDFDRSTEKERSDMSLKASLLHLEDTFDLSANDYLEQTHVDYGSSSYFAGWTYLD
jgi:hypothetical protein